MKKFIVTTIILSTLCTNIFAQIHSDGNGGWESSGAKTRSESVTGWGTNAVGKATPKGDGYPVFDSANLLQSIDDAFTAYDQVMNTISQIENQYEQINNAVEAVKSINWDEFANFEGGFDIRKDIRSTGRRVNNVLNRMRNIENTMKQPSINVGGKSYSVADLCGVGGIGEPGSPDDGAGFKNFFGKQNLWTAMKDEATYMGNMHFTLVYHTFVLCTCALLHYDLCNALLHFQISLKYQIATSLFQVHFL